MSDTSVLVRWTVPPPSSGSLNIVTFKLQYRDVMDRTSSVQGWQTVDDDIPASHRAFEVTRLRPGITLHFAQWDVVGRNRGTSLPWEFANR